MINQQNISLIVQELYEVAKHNKMDNSKMLLRYANEFSVIRQNYKNIHDGEEVEEVMKKKNIIAYNFLLGLMSEYAISIIRGECENE